MLSIFPDRQIWGRLMRKNNCIQRVADFSLMSTKAQHYDFMHNIMTLSFPSVQKLCSHRRQLFPPFSSSVGVTITKQCQFQTRYRLYPRCWHPGCRQSWARPHQVGRASRTEVGPGAHGLLNRVRHTAVPEKVTNELKEKRHKVCWIPRDDLTNT